MKTSDALMIGVVTIAWGVWPLFVKGALRNANSNAITVTLTIGMCGALVLPLLYLFATKEMNFHFSMTWAGVAWALGAYVVNMIAQLAFQRAQVNVPVGVLTAITSMYPAITAIMCYLIFGESITWIKSLGLIAIVGGTIMMTV